MLNLTQDFSRQENFGEFYEGYSTAYSEKVTLELIYDVLDERTKEIKAEMKDMRTEYRGEFRTIKEDLKAINTRVDQIHTRLDQIMHMLTELRK